MTVDTAIQDMERIPTTWAAGPEVGLSNVSHTWESREGYDQEREEDTLSL